MLEAFEANEIEKLMRKKQNSGEVQGIKEVKSQLQQFATEFSQTTNQPEALPSEQ